MSVSITRKKRTTLLVVASLLLATLSIGLIAATSPPEAAKSSTAKDVEKSDETKKELFSGKVVLLQEALKRRGVKSYDEFKEQAVLETDKGELIPIVSDWRGRALFQDERLRDRRIELVGTRQKAAPYMQVLMVFLFDDKGTRQYMDYWCDVCSIPMYEIKPCDCCQADIRLRLQPQELPTFVKPKP